MDLWLRFEDNGTAHGDLVLRLGGERWVSDSYYLALEDGLDPSPVPFITDLKQRIAEISAAHGAERPPTLASDGRPGS